MRPLPLAAALAVGAALGAQPARTGTIYGRVELASALGALAAP